MDNITLSLNLNEVNMVLGVLGKQPYDDVAGLVMKIRERALEQINQVAAGQSVPQPDH